MGDSKKQGTVKRDGRQRREENGWEIKGRSTEKEGKRENGNE
jgi:hypothetical protein